MEVLNIFPKMGGSMVSNNMSKGNFSFFVVDNQQTQFKVDKSRRDETQSVENRQTRNISKV